ncbi:hypothetical protein [Bordetella sp. N]|uniref:hypothetical protein n=1 Tax=Bordetella sp. N TaxID=1746199 RepID=UPI000710DCED|nr:hypothetical protein [Bordetella sp. N]ALM87300.1 hypothetical protein ASB57_26965 [Bordetella sp. N]
MAPRILYLATADARGHLMRAQLLAHALTAAGARVQVITTSDEGRRFLAGFGIDAPVLSRHYAVQFDQAQNMLRRATDANVAKYVFLPNRMLRDLWRLRALMRDADLVVNDSFHPALLTMGILPVGRRKVVHVYGASLRAALEGNFRGRVTGWVANLFSRVIAWQIASARARIEHDFAYPVREGALDARARSLVPGGEASACALGYSTLTDPGPARRLPTKVASSHTYQLPTPVAVATADAGPGGAVGAAVYLNPHFRDPHLADALQAGLAQAAAAASNGNGSFSHCVGEGYADRPGWIARDEHWADHAARSDVIISAPGMAALSIALVYDKPIILVLTDQPEQTANAARAVELDLRHRVVTWRGDAASFRDQVAQAMRELCAPDEGLRPSDSGSGSGSTASASDNNTSSRDSGAASKRATARLDAWVRVILGLLSR